jgi:polar amino acid transport system permease protein
MSTKLFWLMVAAAGYTAAISFVSILLGLALGALVCAAMLSRSRAIAFAGRAYVSFFRGAPLLVQLLLIYNLLPVIGLNVPSLVAALAGLTLCTAAYQAETLRGGFAAVPSGLVEAADVVGLDARQTFVRIRLPIALRLTLPALVNEATMILKASSLISVVGVVELTQMAKNLADSTYAPLPIYATAGGLYLALNVVLGGLAGMAERRFNWGRA